LRKKIFLELKNITKTTWKRTILVYVIF